MVALGTQSANFIRLSDQVVSDSGHLREPGLPRRRMHRLTETQVAELVAERVAGAEISLTHMRRWRKRDAETE